MNNKYIFFSKEGYPHNFQYNSNTEGWEGKVIFDENSDQTFKTQSLHIFESVDPIEFSMTSDFVKIEHFNDSGITFKGESNFENELITNITKSIDSEDFYTKWVYGDRFDKKFPKGTIVTISNIVNVDFLNNQYFTVLDVKKNAFLISTITRNDNFLYTYTSSGYVTSLNMLSINDYNRNLSGGTFIENLYTDKKFSIIDSDYNDSIVSVKQSGITNSYVNDLQLNGNKDNIFTLKIQLFTERPRIFQGPVTLSGSTMIVGRYSKYLEPELIYDSNGNSGLTKKEIIFEDENANTLFNNSSFVVDSLISEKEIGDKEITFKKYYNTTNTYNSEIVNTTQWNTIQFSGITELKKGDLITLSNGELNNQQFKISNIEYTDNEESVIFTPTHITEETGVTYNIIQNLKPNQITKVVVTPSGTVTDTTISAAICYSTSTIINYSQSYISGLTSSMYYDTINSFINKYKYSLYEYGIDVYYTNENDIEYLTVESLYGVENMYFGVSGYTNGIKINDNFSLSDNGITKKYNIITNEKIYDEYTNRSSKKLYKNQVPTEIVFYLKNDTGKFGFRLTLNSNEYFINFNSDTQTTINDFIDKYSTIFYGNGFSINSGYSTEYNGYTLNISSDIDIWDLDVIVNILSTYTITRRERNNFIKLTGNEIHTNSNLYDFGLATGMVINILNSVYNENNKEYNIINLTNNIISLSYQGTIIPETSVNIICKTREFIRKPRGEYDRDVYLRVYWEIPYVDDIDESIFLYDITGEQLTPYNNNSSLEYKGPKPLINTETNNVVVLNDIQNKDITQIYNPRLQQTVFNELTFKLEQLDSSSDYNWVPEPLEIFLGYNSQIEGVNTRTLKIERIEKSENSDNYFVYSGYTNSGTSISTNNFIISGDTINYIAAADFNFVSYGFKNEQLIKLYFKDQSKLNQRIFENTITYKIENVLRNKIIIDTGYTYTHQGIETGSTTTSGLTYFTSTGTTFFYKIEIQPKELLNCVTYGQTEIEDIRYKVNLNNIGIKSEQDIYEILYDSDIQDNAIDYTLFNRKRKEMLANAREIYDYISSYKSLVNAINYFGYNDLELYEYYRYIDKNSYLYEKLHKILIPDIFDNSVEGWNEIDFISGKYQNKNKWTKTNLFNLSYRITDEDGNNVLIYSLEDVQYKLTKLKGWLRQNIIPISANLVDITGLVETKQTLYQDYDESNQTKKSVVSRKSTVVNFNYTATLNFDDNYLVTVNFYTLSGNTNANYTSGTTINNYNSNNINSASSLDYNYNISGETVYNFEEPDSFTAKIKTFYLSACTDDTSKLVPVQYFKINKNDLKPFSFNLNKYVDPYIYIETTTYDNDGNGLGYVNNKMFYYDEPRNHWLVTHNFDLTKMKYWQYDKFINNEPQTWEIENIEKKSTILPTSVETIVNTENNEYVSNTINKN